MITREDIAVDGNINPIILEWAKEEFIGLTEIIELLAVHPDYHTRVSKQYVFNLAVREDFPRPILPHLAMGRIWLASEINEWAKTHSPPGTMPASTTGRPSTHSQEIIHQWRELYDNGNGKNFTEIARNYGVHPTTVSRAIRKEIL